MIRCHWRLHHGLGVSDHSLSISRVNTLLKFHSHGLLVSTRSAAVILTLVTVIQPVSHNLRISNLPLTVVADDTLTVGIGILANQVAKMATIARTFSRLPANILLRSILLLHPLLLLQFSFACSSASVDFLASMRNLLLSTCDSPNFLWFICCMCTFGTTHILF